MKSAPSGSAASAGAGVAEKRWNLKDNQPQLREDIATLFKRENPEDGFCTEKAAKITRADHCTKALKLIISVLLDFAQTLQSTRRAGMFVLNCVR